MLPDGRVPRGDAAAFVGVSAKTLSNWATIGIGPMPRRVGGRVFYLYRDLLAFVATGDRWADQEAGR